MRGPGFQTQLYNIQSVPSYYLILTRDVVCLGNDISGDLREIINHKDKGIYREGSFIWDQLTERGTEQAPKENEGNPLMIRSGLHTNHRVPH